MPSNITMNRENIWRLFFKVRSSSTFNSLWRLFLQRVGVSPTPILYQHLTDLIFKMLIRNRFNYTCSSGCAPSITQETLINEGYALRYAAGYVIRHVLKKIRTSNQPRKDDLIKCCQRLVKTQSSDDAENTAEEWTDLVDRGGLYHVKETTFQLLLPWKMKSESIWASCLHLMLRG